MKESYYLHLSRYIHRNPLEVFKKSNREQLIKYSYSSYPDYCGQRETPWINKDEILNYFRSIQKKDLPGFDSYRDFVENYPVDAEEILQDAVLEED